MQNEITKKFSLLFIIIIFATMDIILFYYDINKQGT